METLKLVLQSINGIIHIAILALLTTTLVESFTVKYYDCTAPKLLHKYSTTTMCKDEAVIGIKNTTIEKWDLLQTKTATETDGYSCQKIVSSWRFYCGAYSHLKLVAVPHIEIFEPIAVATCKRWVNSRQYTTPGGKSHPLTVPGITILWNEDLGAIHAKGSISCAGQDLKINDEIITSTLAVSQLKIVIQKERYKIHPGQNVEVITSHLRLPRNCRPRNAICEMAHRTFYWLNSLTRCNLQRVRTLSVSHVDGYLVDYNAKILLKALHSISAPNGCSDNAILYKTTYEGLYLTRTGVHWEDFTGDVHYAIMTRALNDYSLFAAEQDMKQVMRSAHSNLCNAKLNIHDNHYHQIDDNGSFANRRGDLIYVIRCGVLSGVIYEDVHCTKDIPVKINDGSKGVIKYVDPLTRVLKVATSPAICSEAFPLVVFTEQGSYVKLLPQVVLTNPPEIVPIEKLQEISHQDLSSDTGLYTSQELRPYMKHVEQDQYIDILMETIAYGSQVYNGDIPEDNRFSFDIDQLRPAIVQTTVENLGFAFVKDLKKTVENYGAWISLGVLVIETIKLLTTVVIFIFTFLREGFGG